MGNSSLKEQLQAVASQLSTPKPNNSTNRQNDRRPVPIVKSNPKPKQVVSTKPKWLEYAQYGVELLRAYFPACFKSSNEIQPLKKGIKQDLVKILSTLEAVKLEDKGCMIKSLAYYVNTIAYHKCIIEGAVRVDLDGQPAGSVSAEEAKYSLERQQAKLLARQSHTTSTKLPSKSNQEVVT